MATLPELFALVHGVMAENWPSRLPVKITIYLHGGEAIELPVPPASAGSTPAGEVQAESEAGEEANHCIGDILTVLQTARHPMTGTRIMDALGRVNKTWSKRWVEKHLADMVKDGTLDNPKGVRPLGYCLPEWEAHGEAGGRSAGA